MSVLWLTPIPESEKAAVPWLLPILIYFFCLASNLYIYFCISSAHIIFSFLLRRISESLPIQILSWWRTWQCSRTWTISRWSSKILEIKRCANAEFFEVTGEWWFLVSIVNSMGSLTVPQEQMFISQTTTIPSPCSLSRNVERCLLAGAPMSSAMRELLLSF